MNTHAEQTQENKSQSVANGTSQVRTSGEFTFQFVDNRPEAVAQRKLQEMVNNSPQVQKSIQLQAMADNHSAQQQPIQKKENNTGLPDNLKPGIENLSGYSMDDVKVHYNSDKPAQLQAHAYAQGTDIHLASGQEKHLPHEAWHVVQQKQGRVKPTVQMKGAVHVNDNVGLEKEADVMGGIAARDNMSSKTHIDRAHVQNGGTGVAQLKDPRSKNPYNPQTGITSHHIIPHELLETIIDKFKPDEDEADERPAILKDFLPGFTELTLSNFVAQVSVGVEFDGKSPNKVTELPDTIAFKKFGEFDIEEKGKTKFMVEDAGKISFEAFNGLYTKLLNGEPIIHDKGEGPEEVSGLRDIGESFYEWQSGNLFYGPDRIEPGAKNGFDFDATFIYGAGHVAKLKLIYDKLRALEVSDTLEDKVKMKAALKELSGLSKGVVVPGTDSSIWIKIDNASKKTVHDKLLPNRNATSKEGASIHKDVLSNSITNYCTKTRAHALLTYIGKPGSQNANEQGSPDALFEAKKLKLYLKDNASSESILASTIKRDELKAEMIDLLKNLFGL